jgi:hypothetical protein
MSTDEELYRRARTRARRTPSVLLRRQERRVVSRGREHRPPQRDLLQLAAVRAELRVRRQPECSEGRWSPMAWWRGPSLHRKS